jgi:uncharacterized membrane protein
MFRSRDSRIALFLFLLNFLLKVFYLGYRELTIDEPFSVFHAQMPVSNIVRILAQGNNPPLYEILLHFWIKLAGISEAAVRIPSLLFESIAVVMTYCIGSRYFHKDVGFAAALLLIGSNFLTYHALEARTYMLLVMLSLLSIWFFLRTLENPTRKFIAAYVFFSVLMLYAHYVGLVVLFCQFAAFLFSNKTRKATIMYLLGLVVIGLLFLPQGLIMLHNASASGNSWAELSSWSRFLANSYILFNLPPFIKPLICLIAGGTACALYTHIRNKRNFSIAEWVLLVFTWAGYSIFFLAGLKVPIFIDRYLIFIVAPVYLCISWLIFRLSDKFSPLILLLLVFYALKSESAKTDDGRRYREIIHKVNIDKDQPAVVLFSPAWLDYPIAYYSNKNIFARYQNLDSALSANNRIPFFMGSAFDTAKVIKARTLYLISDHIDPNFRSFATTHFNWKDSAEYADTKVYRLERK